MTALLELKQKIRDIYGEYDTWIVPALKFLLALAVFLGINSKLGFLEKLDNIFVVLILSVICAILPINAMTVVGCVLIIGHCYAVGVEVAAFALLLMILLMILFLRFTSKDNLAMILAPTSFSLHIPAAVPMGGGLLRGPSCAVPACCGVILYFFMDVVKEKSSVLQAKETEAAQKLQLLLDGLMKNQEMWLYVISFLVVLMLIYLISRCSFDYSWRAANATGAIAYIVIMILGSMFLDVHLNIGEMIAGALGAVVVGLVIEFFVLGIDYSRSETTQFEDDEYVYYVKAVPKSVVAQKEKRIKKISSEKGAEGEAGNDKTESDDVSEGAVKEPEFDFEKQLEESLKDL